MTDQDEEDGMEWVEKSAADRVMDPDGGSGMSCQGWTSGVSVVRENRIMRKIFYVDLRMCGGESVPEDFDIEEFCEVLQGKVQADIEIVPVLEATGAAMNLDPTLVTDHIFHEALGEYCHR